MDETLVFTASEGAAMMEVHRLIEFFAELNEDAAEYVLIGGVAAALHGAVHTSEVIELLTPTNRDNESRIGRVIHRAWPGINEISTPGRLRFLSKSESFAIDIISVEQFDGVDREWLTFEGVVIPVVPLRSVKSADLPILDDRSGIHSIAARMLSLSDFVSPLVPAIQMRGVRKYRSIEAMAADRERLEGERIARIHAERLAK